MIEYKVGNLFDLLPKTSAPIIIPHIVNTLGIMGSGFVIPLKKRWPQTEELYRNWYQNSYDYERNIPFELGQAQVICVEYAPSPIFVVNMIAQEGLMSATNPSPIKYHALARCMAVVAQLAKTLTYSYTINTYGYDLSGASIGNVQIQAPAFGTERAGGDPAEIKQMIEKLWGIDNSLNITIYALKEPHPFQTP